ncbi:MAG: ABC transporter ATP-binding protein [Capsulimonas sp.]|uniref:ABC transporter ATP-binding protein n=1 Tax=Capsulimonas sp. TaxID=2494211 RepID=UPI003262F8D2
MEDYSIICENLTKIYKGGKKSGDIVAVDHISLRVPPGEFYGFLGPNGAGKSTSIKMLTGLLRPTSGRVAIAGHDLATDGLAVKRAIGVLPEDLNLYERLTASEFLIFAGQMYGMPAAEAKRRAEELLGVMELSDSGDKLIVDFSMGMKKKTALAGAMIHNPRVLFLDEPFNGIDALSSRKIRDVLRQRTEQGTTVFFSSHVLEVVEKLCTRVAIIARGKLVGEGTMDELRALTQDNSLEDIFVHLVATPEEAAPVADAAAQPWYQRSASRLDGDQ